MWRTDRQTFCVIIVPTPTIQLLYSLARLHWRKRKCINRSNNFACVWNKMANGALCDAVGKAFFTVKMVHSATQYARRSLLSKWCTLRRSTQGVLYCQNGALCDAVCKAFFTVKIQRDSKRWTQFLTSVFPELYMVCEWSTLHLKEEVLNVQIPPLERSPNAQPCSSVSWDSVLMNSRTQKILRCIIAILLSTDAAARLCARRAL